MSGEGEECVASLPTIGEEARNKEILHTTALISFYTSVFFSFSMYKALSFYYTARDAAQRQLLSSVNNEHTDQQQQTVISVNVLPSVICSNL